METNTAVQEMDYISTELQKFNIADQTIAEWSEVLKAEALKKTQEEAAKKAKADLLEKQKQEAERKAEVECKAKARAERLEALKPVKQKLADFANALLSIEVPVLNDLEADAILHSAKELLAKTSAFIIEKSETL